MAKRLDDTEDRPPQDRYPAGRHPEVEAAEFEAEQPARDLTGLPRLVISVAAVAVSLYALFWVVRPQPAQPYRTSFLAVTLAMTLLAYRPLARGGKATEEERAAGGDNPGPLDWALAALALVALIYPLLVFDDFARRVVRPTGLDVVLGVVAVLLVLEATRRTVGWVLPAICLGFVAYAFFGGLLPFGWELGHKGYDLERLVGQAYMGIEGAVRGPPGRGRHLHRAVHHLRGGAGVLGGWPVLHRRQLRRLRDPVGGRPRPHRHPGRVPARHRLRVGGGDHGHPGVGGLAGAAAGRLPAQPGRRGPVGGRDRGHPVPADPGRGRLHHRRVPGDLLPAGAAVRHHGRCCTPPGSPSPSGSCAARPAGRPGGCSTAWPPAPWGACRWWPCAPPPGDRGRGLADRAGSQGQLADRRRGRRHPGPGRDLLGRCGPCPGAGRAGDGVVHHLGGDRRPGPGRARGRRGGRLHVHLLLRGAVRGEPAHRPVVGGGGRHHRRGRVQDDDADPALHPAGVPGPLRLRAQPQRRGAAAPGADPGHRLDAGRGRGRGGRPGRGHRGWLLGPARPAERVLAGLAAPFLLYLEPLTIAIGAGLLVAAVAVHLALRRSGGAPSAAGPSGEATA